MPDNQQPIRLNEVERAVLAKVDAVLAEQPDIPDQAVAANAMSLIVDDPLINENELLPACAMLGILTLADKNKRTTRHRPQEAAEESQ